MHDVKDIIKKNITDVVVLPHQTYEATKVTVVYISNPLYISYFTTYLTNKIVLLETRKKKAC